ncbi:hypothetical protein [Paenibacillus sp. GYB003]|uniref:hypothetical protein n=1 Tax=Paenibacillus sp. GYB003 TaxID=2994392 RepID=UPI002F961FB5
MDEQLKKLTGGSWTGTSGTGTGQSGGGSAGSGVTEQQVKEWMAAEAEKIKQELKGQIPSTGNSSSQPPSIPSTGAGTASLEVIKLEAGQILYGGIGAEIIVRTGKAIAVSNDDGIPDVTSGKDVPVGTAIETNHLLVIPREGRGIKPDPKNKDEIYVMIRGSYILLKEDGTKVSP